MAATIDALALAPRRPVMSAARRRRYAGILPGGDERRAPAVRGGACVRWRPNVCRAHSKIREIHRRYVARRRPLGFGSARPWASRRIGGRGRSLAVSIVCRVFTACNGEWRGVVLEHHRPASVRPMHMPSRCAAPLAYVARRIRYGAYSPPSRIGEPPNVAARQRAHSFWRQPGLFSKEISIALNA